MRRSVSFKLNFFSPRLESFFPAHHKLLILLREKKVCHSPPSARAFTECDLYAKFILAEENIVVGGSNVYVGPWEM